MIRGTLTITDVDKVSLVEPYTGARDTIGALLFDGTSVWLSSAQVAAVVQSCTTLLRLAHEREVAGRAADAAEREQPAESDSDQDGHDAAEPTAGEVERAALPF